MKIMLKSLFSFNGIVSKSKFLKYVIPMLVIYSILFYVPIKSTLLSLLSALAMLAVAISYYSFIVRRFRDLNRSGLSIFLLVVPFYNLYLIYLLIFKKGISNE
jgi:uncharacterized membrane protein YhaH (DUF805 family)